MLANGVTFEDIKIANLYLKENGYEDLDAWARDSDFVYCEGCDEDSDSCGWVDYDDNPVDILGCLFGALESSGELDDLRERI